jgi:hypothetical protein
MSPTVFREDGFQFWFYSNEKGHEPHVHVSKSGQIAAIWIADGSVKEPGDMRGADLRQAQRIVRENATDLLEAWRRYHEKR